MAITKEKKKEVVAKAKLIASNSSTIAFASFKGLSVNAQNEMRRSLRGLGVDYSVIKKTLLRRGFDGSFSGTMPALEGEIAITYGVDQLAPARELAVFIKKHPGLLAFAGGVFDGAYVSKEEIMSIASIPGIDTLRAQFVQLINSPIQRLAVVLDQAAQKGK